MSFFNNPVRAAVFQAAFPGLVERLLRIAGKTEDVNIQLIWSGDTACALWSYYSAYDDKTGALRNKVRGTIKLPELKENSVLSREKANRWVAYVIHEVWHITFTDANVWATHVRNNPGLRSKLANALEDVRIERAGMTLGYARGFEVIGRELLQHLMEAGGMDVNPNDPCQIPWSLAVYGRGYGVKGEKRLLSALDKRVEKIFAAAKQKIHAVPVTASAHDGTTASCDIAQWVYKELVKLGKEPQPQPPLPPDNPVKKPPPRDRSDDGADRDDHDDEREQGDAEDETYNDERQPGDEGQPGDDDQWEDGEGDGPVPLKVGDKVICPDGSKGKITAINGDDAEVAPL